MRINIFRISSIISLVAAAMALQSMCAKTQDSLKHHSKADSILSLELERVPSITLNDWRTLDYDTIELQSSYAFVPLIFCHQTLSTDTIATWKSDDNYSLNVDRSWINNDIKEANKVNRLRYAAMAAHPDRVIYNANELPEAPKECGKTRFNYKKCTQS